MGERRGKENRRRRRRRKPKRRNGRSSGAHVNARMEEESAVAEISSPGGESEIWIYTYTRYKRDKYR